MTKVRSRVAAALALAAALTASACGLGSTSASGPTTVAQVPQLGPDQQVSLVFESYNFGQAGAWTDTFNDLITKFQQAHPNIHVKAQKPQGNSPNPATDAVSSVQAQLAAGSPPDVAQLGFGDLDFAIHGLGAKPLDDLVGKDAVQANFNGAKYPYAPAAKPLGDWDGKTYGMPFVFSTPVLYYNASLFQQAGLDPSKPPTTWDEVATDAAAIKNVTHKDGVYIDALSKESKDYFFQALVRSNGGRVISPDRKSLTFADPATVQVVQMGQNLVNAGSTPKLGQVQAYTEFARGDMGMILETSAIQATFVKGATGKWDLRSAAMPSFAGKPAIPTNSGSALFVLSNDPAKQRAAWELTKFLTSEEAFTEITSKIGYLPLRTGLLDDPAYLKDWAARNPLIKPNVEQLSRMEPWVSFPGNSYTQIMQGMMDAVEKSVYQGADPASTLSAAQAQASTLMPK
ncbi:MAG TPA: ABC transporter substrate-binding protein [Amycolatopsis sp.]|nr:ABC transporter substrate-binding protein [Amycolatopsis sp.]